MADEVKGERFQGREPYRAVPPEPHVYYMGDHGPFPGQKPSRSDEDIKRDIDTALFYDEAVSSLGIDVSVQNGVVTLSGTVSSELAKRLAGDDAWKVGGVCEVKNDVQVHELPTPSRAAGQDVVAAKPPEPGYGEPLPQQVQPPTPQPGQQTRQKQRGQSSQ